MTILQLLVNLMQLLFDMAVPAAMCTLVLAGLALREESGVNFEVGGRFQRWMLWSVILLPLPQFLSWFAAQGINVPPQGAGISGSWLRGMETSFTGFISDVVVGKLVPVWLARPMYDHGLFAWRSARGLDRSTPQASEMGSSEILLSISRSHLAAKQFGFERASINPHFDPGLLALRLLTPHMRQPTYARRRT